MGHSKETVVRRTPVPGSTTHPLVTPLMPSVAYGCADPSALDAQYEGRSDGYTYAREGHPNAAVLARKIDALEAATGGIVTGSGMGALAAIYLGLLKAGDHIVASAQLYGRNLRLLQDDLPRLGIDVSLADATDAGAVARAMGPATRLVVIETVANPTLRIPDVGHVAATTREAGARLVLDNTFATPAMCQGLALGADIVMHSVTKLLAGHSDVTLGYVAAADKSVGDAIADAAVTWGLTASPFDCWLAERGVQTFGLRFERAQANAAALADHLAARPEVEAVFYPARNDHPDADRAARLFGGAGGTMVSFRLAGDRATADRFVRAATNIPFAPTLGDVATTLSHPATSSHRGMRAEDRAALGITEGFFRLSVGVEPLDLLRAELDAAIGAAQ